MKSILSGFLVAALASCFSPPSQAAEANWKSTQYWAIVGDYVGYCRAEAQFGTDTVINIAVNKTGWSFIFSNDNAIPMNVGQQYTVKVSDETGASGTLTGKAIDAKILSFPGLTLETVVRFAKAKSITVGNFGTYNLKGSADAILETYACFKALTASGASAPAPEAPVEEREA
jgi:hypothetical protein